MPGRKTTSTHGKKYASKPTVFVHARGTHAVETAWLDSLCNMGCRLFSHADLPGVERTENEYRQLGALLKELLAVAPGQPIILLRAGINLTARLAAELTDLLNLPDAPTALSVMSSAEPGFNPFSGLASSTRPSTDKLTAAVRLLGERVIYRQPVWPLHCLALSSSSAAQLAQCADDLESACAYLSDRIGLPGWLFAEDLRAAPFTAEKLAPHESPQAAAWGELGSRLQAWLDAGAPPLPEPGRDGRTVTLHITHSWGGGVSLWTEAFIKADQDGDHLQLRSESAQSGHGSGQRLALYLGNELRFPLAQWWLQPAIQSLEVQHGPYREALKRIVAGFGVGRVVVSSLVGHSLDALRTGLPTVQVLHDYFPTWPLLSVHPQPYLRDEQPADLEAALREHRHRLEFKDHTATSWSEIRATYLDTLREYHVRLAAPSRSVMELHRRLDPAWRDIGIEWLPHGALPLAEARPVLPRPRADGRLHLLILGRIQDGKGKELLREALPRLTPHAQVYLLGTGKQGEAFFGMDGVSVVQQYRRESLQQLLDDIGPHVAGLLSVVPETHSYTLSELIQFCIPVIATRVGSFSERIEDGVDGWLIDPTTDALADRVARLAAEPEMLASVRAHLAQHAKPNSLAEMIAAYGRLCPPRAPDPVAVRMAQSLESAQANASAFLATRAQLGLKAGTEKYRDLQREMDRRARWAEARQAELEHDLARRLAWAQQLNEELEARTDWARSLERELQDERQYRTETVAQLHDELREERGRLANAYSEQKRLGSELQRVTGQLRERQSELGASRAELQKERQDRRASEQRLGDERDHLARNMDRLRFEFDRVLASSSWRLTRPFRAARRMATTLWQARIYNPARWPMLFARGLRVVTTSGLGGAARRLNQPAQSQSEPAPRPIAPPAHPPAASKPAPEQPASSPAGLKSASEQPSQPTVAQEPGPKTEPGRTDEPVEPAPPVPTETTPELPPLAGFPEVEEPMVSIVIPAYNHWDYTHRCLASLAATPVIASFEVILVDDSSSEDPPDGLTGTPGLRILRNAENLGFIGSCNAGAEAARGAFLVLLNNDTEVRDGWLDELLRTFEAAPDTGLAGARLVYPDGRLQECGGMIFSDGSGWNYGRNDDPNRPEYQYAREVDYCSGACIMLRTGVFRELGGFDSHYAPAYYEDTDLAFRIREKGLKVRVQPAAEVVHYEGITSGTDTGSSTAIKRYQEVNRDKFLTRWQDALTRQPPPIADPDDLAVVRRSRDHRLRGRILVIDATTPEPDQDSGSVRLTNLMQCFLDLGYGVTFFADNRLHAGRYTRQLQARGIEVWHLPWIQAPGRFFEQHGADFDFVFISRHYIAVNYLSLLRRHCPDTPFIFDTVDLHYLREMRLAELEDSTALRQVARQTRRSELGVIAAADVTLVVSPAEVDVLAGDAPGAHVHVVSNIHDVTGRRTDFEDRKGLFFVGGYQHPPNVDAARWFVGEVWPKIRDRLPGVPFHLIGSKAPPEIEALAGNGVVFHGFVESLEPFLDGCRLAIAPLRYGAGVKGKVNMSMSYGQPVVATPIAVEGMYAEDGRDVLVADTAEAFADQVVRLYQDSDLWLALSNAAIENVRRHFSLEAARTSLSDLLESLRKTAD